jgi:hypothetical protein
MMKATVPAPPPDRYHRRKLRFPRTGLASVSLRRIFAGYAPARMSEAGRTILLILSKTDYTYNRGFLQRRLHGLGCPRVKWGKPASRVAP